MGSVAQRYTPEQVIVALQEAKGYVTHAAENLGCTAGTVYVYRDRYEEVADAWKHIRESRIDHAEKQLRTLIDGRRPSAIYFFLKHQGKERGYGHSEVQIDGQDPFEVTYVNYRDQTS